MDNKWITSAIGVLALGLIVNFIWTDSNARKGAPNLTEDGYLNPTYWWNNNEVQYVGTYAAPKMYVDTQTRPGPSWLNGGGSVVTFSTGVWAR